MTLTLSKDTIQWLLESQQKLDDNIKQVKGISNDDWEFNLDANHQLAFNVEVHEFINECHDIWKYWKSKPVNLERILDEAVDVIHFAMLMFNKFGDTADVIENDLSNKYLRLADVKNSLKDMSQSSNIVLNVCHLLSVLEHYSFTEQDIINQYKIKNKENFRRLETGY